MVRRFLPLSALLLMPACASTQIKRDLYTAELVAQKLDSLRRVERIPGLAVAMLQDTTVLLARGFGLANIERNVPVTPETPFNTASVSKTISGTLAMMLVEQGKLDLDRPMRSYQNFNEFCDAALGDGGVFFGDYACKSDKFTMRHVLGMSANGAEPGTRFLYNPPSFSWASRPMAEVIGVPFSELVDSLILKPAGMRNAARTHRRLPLPPRIASELATPYHLDAAGNVVQSDPPPPQGDGAAGGVIASAMDLARFDIALMTNRLISAKSREAMWTGITTPSGAQLPYGLGWFLGRYNGRRVVWHTGLWDGQYSALYLKVLSDVPSERYTLVLLANSESLRWQTRLDEAAIERSPFARAFLDAFR